MSGSDIPFVGQEPMELSATLFFMILITSERG